MGPVFYVERTAIIGLGHFDGAAGLSVVVAGGRETDVAGGGNRVSAYQTMVMIVTS